MTDVITGTLPTFEQILTQVISTSSISSNLSKWDESNLKVVSVLADYFEALGASVDIYPVPNSNDKFNLLARFIPQKQNSHKDNQSKQDNHEGGLLLAGHSDTVPFDEKRWSHDPLKLQSKDNRFYGLGTCDMKSFFVFIVEALKELKESGEINKLKKPLYVLATADEETTMAGARYFAEQQLLKADVAIIGEPTGLAPVFKHKGHMSHRINIKGKSGHSSNPAHGINAIEIMMDVLNRLMSFKQYLAMSFQDGDFDVPYPTLNFGAIHGGDNANRICGECYLDIDIRAIPGVSDKDLIYLLNKQLEPIAKQYPGRLHIEELHLPCPSFAPHSNDQANTHATFSMNDSKCAFDVAESVTNMTCCAVDYCTEAPFIQSVSRQTIVLGPGSIEQAHQADEFLAHEQIKPTLKVLRQFIKQYCF